MKFMSWEAAAKFCEDTFGVYVDWEDHGWYTCPVCEIYWEDIE